ncbi:MAG: UDP-2,3-diacylglucosamine diphosphatase LpxI [Candidatus Omnitrophica bacterium]|nr:UDP-2,3-diacylglucosamine diphosphatase LpxI [Candidatus Omnitrophota bacterium]
MKTIGIIAGNGKFPVLAVKEARNQGYRVAAVLLEGEAEPALEKMTDANCWVKVGELAKLAKFFRSEGVHEAMMAGKVEKVRLFQENVRPDFEMVKVLMKIRDFKDDSLLAGIADYLHAQGIDLMDSTIFMKESFPGEGVLGKKKPSKEVLEEIDFGFRLAKAMGGLDVGQTVVVKKKAVLAVEAIEGTDQAIRRGGELGGGKVTVVKTAKPNQDMRFDVPAVGLGTLRALISVKAQAFAFEAGKTLFIDQGEFVKGADQKGIVLMGVKDSGHEEKKE